MVKSTPYVPQRGDAVWIDFDPQAGHEQAKRRPALVLSPAEYNRSALQLALLCPITSDSTGNPWEVPLPKGLKSASTGQALTGVVLSDQVKSMDWKARKVARICKLPAEVVAEVLGKLMALLKPEEE